MYTTIYKETDFKSLLEMFEKSVEEKQAKLILATNGKLKQEYTIAKYHKKAVIEAIHSCILAGSKEVPCPLIHVRINFPAIEKAFFFELNEVAIHYMKGLGYIGQPMLIYRKNQSMYASIDIISVCADFEGNPIEPLADEKQREYHQRSVKYDIAYIEERNEAFKIKIEAYKEKFANLEKVENPQQIAAIDHKEGNIKERMERIIHYVLTEKNLYSYKQFCERLLGYNIKVEHYQGKGNKSGREGLLYFVTNEQGKKVSVPLKASLFECYPTLRRIEEIFAANIEANREEPLAAKSNKGGKGRREMKKNSVH